MRTRFCGTRGTDSLLQMGDNATCMSMWGRDCAMGSLLGAHPPAEAKMKEQHYHSLPTN